MSLCGYCGGYVWWLRVSTIQLHNLTRLTTLRVRVAAGQLSAPLAEGLSHRLPHLTTLELADHGLHVRRTPLAAPVWHGLVFER